MEMGSFYVKLTIAIPKETYLTPTINPFFVKEVMILEEQAWSTARIGWLELEINHSTGIETHYVLSEHTNLASVVWDTNTS
jgi:hypothetical protein